MNKKKFEYHSRNGTLFKCDTCDFSTPIDVYAQYDSFVKEGVKFEALSKLILPDVAEMIGYHAINIHPELNGFAGYDCLRFNTKDSQSFYGDGY